MTPPPEFVVRDEPLAGVYFMRINNPKTLVEIRRAKDMEVDWKVKVWGYNPHYSKTIMPPSGKYLVHLKSGFDVHELDTICLEVFTKTGKRHAFEAKELMDKLVDSKIKSQFSPKNGWIR